LDNRNVVGCEFVVAHCDPPARLDYFEKMFDRFATAYGLTAIPRGAPAGKCSDPVRASISNRKQTGSRLRDQHGRPAG
jgi:hypothetical protein